MIQARGGPGLPPRGFATHGTTLVSGSKPFSGHPQTMTQTPTPNQDYLTPGPFPSRTFPRILDSLGPRPRDSPPGVCPTGHRSPTFATRPGHPRAPTIPDGTIVQEGPKIVVTCGCATMALDHTTATITYVMWHEEHLRNVSVLQSCCLEEHGWSMCVWSVKNVLLNFLP
jgi:hypothetical protein